MDLVYTTSPDPIHNHIELKFSIRSMEKYLHPLDQIAIVGELPAFLDPAKVIHIPFTDQHKYNAGRNIYEKTLAAAKDPRISKHFFAAADDHFLLAPLAASGYPYFHTGDLAHLLSRLGKKSLFKAYVQSTHDALVARDLPIVNFSVHIPIIYSKDIFIEVMDQFDWNLRKSYIIKSLYANWLRIPGVQLKDSKIDAPYTKTAIARRLQDRLYFSTNEWAVNDPMIETWQELFPEPSRVEFS